MALEFKNVTKSFGRIKAIDNASFTIPDGNIFGFIGPNGAGKTTALRLISGVDTPDCGDILWNGTSVVQYSDKLRKKIGYMPDLLPDVNDITVKEFLNFYASAFGFRNEQKKAVLDRVYDLTRAAEIEKKLLCDLSKGMKQRVNTARILIHDPDLLLLDEPAAGLDPMTRIELRNILKQLSFEGKTILISSHILSELEDMVSGMVIIEKGKILQSGRREDIAAVQENTIRREQITFKLIPGTDPSHWVELLEKCDWAENIRSNENGTVTLDVNSSSLAALLNFAAEKKLPFSSLHRSDFELNIETIFMSCTSGEIQ